MKEVLSQNGIQYAYVDILSSVGALKKFLKIRDTSDSHTQARANHFVGIPTLMVEDTAYVVEGGEETQALIQQLHLSE